MKSSLHTVSFFVLLLLSLFRGDLSANNTTNTNLLLSDYVSLADYISEGEDNSCYAPTWFNSHNPNHNSCTFQWDEVYGAQYYLIQWRYSGGPWYWVNGNCYNNWVYVDGLEACHSYEWRVRSHCSYGYDSPWSYPNSFSTTCNDCPKPYSLYATDITSHSVQLHWSEVWGASGYVVQIQSPNGAWTNIPGSPCDDNWLEVWNLEPGTMYEWRVKATCDYYNSSDWAYGWFTTAYYYSCHYPTWLDCYDITDYSATWKWEHVYGAQYYHIQWRHSGGTWYDLGGNHYGTWVNVNHLSPCTNYEWRVKSYCNYGGWSNWCYPHSFKTTCHSSCSTPGNPHTIDIGDYKATLKWTPVYGASSYTIQMKNAWGSWTDISGSPTYGTWITVSNLSPCTSYEWRIKANCHYGSSSYWSNPVWFTTTCGNGCYAPQWVYTNGITGSSAILHWAPVNSAEYYVVEWRPANGTWSEVPGGPFSNPYVELSGLQSNTTYEWRVKSHCYTGYWSGWSSQTYFQTLGLSCGLPFYRYTTPITDSTATLNWSAVAGALNYTVQIRELNGIWVDVVGSPTIGTSITVTDLAPNTTYEWKMQVNCANGGYSPWLSAIKFTTGSSNGCATPGSLYADNLSLNAATLNWSAVAGAATYSVDIRIWPGGAWNPVIGSPVATNSITVDGLTAFTTYEWRVRTNCSSGHHSFHSVPSQFTTTNAPPCNPPSGLAASAITETTAMLSWSPVLNAQGYQVQTRLPNGTWIDLSGGGADTFLLATGFTQNTTYEWRVRAQCDVAQFSNWSAVATFTTTGGAGIGNDNCENATLLTVETSCVATFASNIDATASTPPPAGGCWSNGYKDVWFKFSMPDVANPAVTIRTSAGSLGNAVMEVYSGSDCGIQSVIACEDNNDNGNGSSMPVINLSGTPGATIWVRVWGYDGSTGTFTICVFNGISFNYTGVIDEVDPTAGEAIEEIETVSVAPTESLIKAELQVTPNPVSDQLNVVVQQTDVVRVTGLRIMDLSGVQVIHQKIEPLSGKEFKTGVDVSTLVPGMYVLQVQTTAGMMAEKISVIR
jgi:hypothetical protein